MQTFSGENAARIRDWLREFDGIAKLCAWIDAHKLLYCRQLLRGPAKLFIQTKNCSKSWNSLQSALRKEFSMTVNSYHVHRQLRRRKKRPTESYQQYIYRMIEIANPIKIDESSIINYIIDGIDDNPVNKTILYEAKSVRHLKEKLQIYERMKEAEYPEPSFE